MISLFVSSLPAGGEGAVFWPVVFVAPVEVILKPGMLQLLTRAIKYSLSSGSGDGDGPALPTHAATAEGGLQGRIEPSKSQSISSSR